MLEQGVILELDGLALCAHPHSGNRGCVRIGKFHGDRFPLALLLAARAKIREDVNAGVDTPCTGCDLLRKQAWERSVHPVRYVTVNDWIECNLRCEYCYTLDERSRRLVGEKKTHDLFRLMKDMIDNRFISPDAYVDWGGGEVTIYEAFEPTALLLAEAGIRQQVNTNAVLYSGVIERGLRAGTMSVQVSVDAGTRESYHRIKGRDAFEAVWEHIGKYVQAGPVTVKYIVCEGNSGIGEMREFLDRCLAKGVTAIAVVPEGMRNSRGGFSQEAVRNAAAMIEEAGKAGMSVKTIPFLPQAFDVPPSSGASSCCID